MSRRNFHGDRWPAGTLLGELSPNAKEELLSLGLQRRFEAGATLLHEGERSSHVVLLVDAWVKVMAATESGNVALLDIRVSGDLVGEQAGLDAQPRSATVVTASRSVVRIIQQPDFLRFLQRNPDAAILVGRAISAKLRWATRRRVDFSTSGVKVRLARVLDELAESYGDPVQAGILITPTLTQPELAGLVGAREGSVHKAIAEFRSQAIVRTGYGRVTVLDRRRLRAVAGLLDEST